MLPDTGERYLTTPLFDGIASEMTQEETIISQSTPKFRFDVSSEVQVDTSDIEIDANAVDEINALVSDKGIPIVMFALEWCEFCWSVRKVLAEYGVEYRSVDLDSVAYQQNNRGAKMRVALRDKTTWNTFPQIFINGEFFGGCVDLFDGLKEGSLQEKLNSLNISYDESITRDPYTFLPGWLHPR